MVTLTFCSNHAHDDGCCCGRTLHQYCSQNTDHKISDRVTEDFIGCKGFSSGFSSQQSEGTTQKIQGADKKVQKSKEKDDLAAKQGNAFNLS